MQKNLQNKPQMMKFAFQNMMQHLYKKMPPQSGWHFESFFAPCALHFALCFYKLFISFTSFCIVLFASPNNMRVLGLKNRKFSIPA